MIGDDEGRCYDKKFEGGEMKNGRRGAHTLM